MPLYRGTIEKLHPSSGERWSNVYDLLTGSATDALTTLDAIRSMEMLVSYVTVQATRINVVNVADRNDRKSTVLSGATGALPVTGLGGDLPLFLTVLCTFSDNVRRPERKFLRTGAQRNNLENGLWSGEYTDYVDDNYTQPLFGSLEYVGPSGERPTSGATSNIVQERQLGWHRRTRPGFHRGWVPD